jgi:hypothetical protein
MEKKTDGNSVQILRQKWPGERHTIEELAWQYELYPTQINTWKREFLAKTGSVFSGPDPEAEAKKESDTEKLYAKIGQLEIENDWLKKN